MSDRQVWVEDDGDGDIWVGLDSKGKTLCLLLRSAEVEQLMGLLAAVQEAHRG